MEVAELHRALYTMIDDPVNKRRLYLTDREVSRLVWDSAVKVFVRTEGIHVGRVSADAIAATAVGPRLLLCPRHLTQSTLSLLRNPATL